MDHLDPPVARRIVAKLEQASLHPDRFFARLVGSSDSKLRIGDYRLIAVLVPESKLIVVERVDHRSRIYQRER